MAERADEVSADPATVRFNGGSPVPPRRRRQHRPVRPRAAWRRRSPLLGVAAVWGVRQGTWSLLVVLVFTVLAVACSALPMFGEAADNAAFDRARAAVPAGARQSDAAVVRLTGSALPASADQRDVVDDVAAIPGLSAPTLNGKSVGVELARPALWESFLVRPGGRLPARLFALPDPAAQLVAEPAGGTGRGGGGVWLPAPVARELGVTSGATVTFAARTAGDERRVTATVAGVYRVAEDGRRPLDRPGRRDWSLRRSELPVDSGSTTLPSYLVIGEVRTAERLAKQVGDQMLWSVDADLAPGLTLAEAKVVAAQVDELRKRYVRGRTEEEVLARRVASGIGVLTEQAGAVSAAVRQRTRPLEWAAVLVALTSLVAVVVAALRRRDVELRHAVGAGTPNTLLALWWALEHVVPALAGGVLGWLLAWGIVGWLGPAGAVTTPSVRSALTLAMTSAAAGILLVGGVAAAAAARRVSPATPAARRRRVPWLVLVVVTAVTATAGLAASDPSAEDARSIDLFVPLLVFTAAGALGAALLPRLVRPTSQRSGPPRPTAIWFARRRLGAAVPGRAPVTAAVTAGVGMVLFALCGVAATRDSIDDRVAVAGGAAAVATIDGSWQLDDSPVMAPPRAKAGEPEPPDDPVPGVRTPPVPDGTTLVWRIDITNTVTMGTQQLLLVDPAAFLDVASWGHGPDLARARSAVRQLDAAAQAATRDRRRPVPAVAVGAEGIDVGDVVQVEAGPQRSRIEVVDTVEVFPGQRDEPLYVVPDQPTLAEFGVVDPRLMPRDKLSNGVFARVQLWGVSDEKVDAALSAHGVQAPVSTTEQLRRRDIYVAAQQAGGYHLAIGGYLALLAVLALCVHAQRRAAADRPTDLMLARLGVGRGRVMLSRAVELATIAAVSLLCAVAALLLIKPLAGRLLDVAPDEAPTLRLAVTPTALAAAALTALLAAAAATAISSQRPGRGEEEAYRTDA